MRAAVQHGKVDKGAVVSHRLRGWIPAELLRLINHWSGRSIRLSGNFASWENALRRATGYDSDAILTRATEAALAVRDGRGAFERDGVVFPEPELPFPLLAALLRTAARSDGQLRVLDFGGALGSTYYQSRSFLDGLVVVRWQVVEQPHFAARGTELFGNDVLGFSPSIADAVKSVSPNAIVLSGVLQYIPDPVATLRELAAIGAQTIVIDRTPVINGERDVIALQSVSSRIVRSSYPVRLFTQARLLAPLEDRYRLLADFDAVDSPMGGVLRRIEFKGYVLDKCVGGKCRKGGPGTARPYA